MNKIYKHALKGFTLSKIFYYNFYVWINLLLNIVYTVTPLLMSQTNITLFKLRNNTQL